MTSQWAWSFVLGINKSLLTLTTMACAGLITFYSIAKLFSGNEKMIQRGENAYKSGHVTEFTYDADVGRVYGRVEASMRNVQYDAEVGVVCF